MRQRNLILLILLLILPLSLNAQSQSSDAAHRRADCRLAEQIIRTGHPAPHTEWAYHTFGACVDSNPSVLVQKWSGAPLSDTLEVVLLSVASRRFPRREVFDAVAAAALNPSNGTYQRVAAMGLLASFAKPGIYLSFRELMNPIPGRRIPRVTFSGDQASSQVGELEGVASEVVSLMLRIQADTADPALRRIAGEYVRFLNT